MCCIRVKFELLKLLDIVGYRYCDEYCYWAQVVVLLMYLDIGLLEQVILQVLYLGRAPRTKETLLDFRERCRVTRHSRVFPRVDG